MFTERAGKSVSFGSPERGPLWPPLYFRGTPMITRDEVVELGTQDLIDRLDTTRRELEALAPAPRVELDRESLVALVTLSANALKALSRVH